MLTAAKKDKGLAVICLTCSGVKLGQKLLTGLGGGVLYAPRRLQNSSDQQHEPHYFDDFKEAFAEVFSNFSHLICIMAAGIVVRSLAPLIRSKHIDPAVVVMDEKGRHAISLLSGHVGGGNRLANLAARISGGEAVITTASDVQGRPAADLLALEIQAVIKPRQNIKIINRHLAEGDTVYLYSRWPVSQAISSGFVVLNWPGPGEAFKEPAVIISHNNSAIKGLKGILQLKPRNLVLGVGSRKGVSWASVHRAFHLILDDFDIDPFCIKALATIDLKANEAAINKLAKELEIPLLGFNKEQISTLQGRYEDSQWVQEKIGVGGVCEPAALFAVQPGITMVPKQKMGPVTMSIAMEKSWWLDWDQEEENI